MRCRFECGYVEEMNSQIPRENDIFNDISFSVGYNFQNQQNNRHKNKLVNKDNELKETNKNSLSNFLLFQI